MDLSRIDWKKVDFIVAPFAYRRDLYALKSKEATSKTKIYDKNDLFYKKYGKLDRAAVYVAMDICRCNLENALFYLRELYPVPAKNNGDTKVALMLKLRDELKKKGLLVENPYFDQEFNNKKILVIGYDDDPEIKNIFPNAEFLRYETTGSFSETSVQEFPDTRRELYYVYNDVCDKLKNNIPAKKIHVIINDAYLRAEWNRISLTIGYGKPFATKTPLGAFPEIRRVLKEIEQDSLSSWMNEKKTTLEEQEVASLVTEWNVLHHPNELNNLKAILKRTFIADRQPAMLRGLSDLPLYRDGHYYYLLGFYDDAYPRVVRNDDYFSDEEKEKIGRLTSVEENKLNRARLSDFVAHQNVFLSYSLLEKGDAKHSSYLIREKHLRVDKHPSLTRNKIYLKNEALFDFAALKNAADTYGINDELIKSYAAVLTLPSPFASDFKAFPIAPASTPRNYSYSKMKTYIECPFKYYLKNVLRIDPFESTYATIFGSVAHGVFEDFGNRQNKFNFDVSFAQRKKDEIAAANKNGYEWTNADETMMLRNKDDIKRAIDLLAAYQNGNPNVRNYAFELALESEITSDLKINGKIDKVLEVNYDYNDKGYVVVDYKTGSTDQMKPETFTAGYSLQLPIYAYLLTRGKRLDNTPLNIGEDRIFGFFLNPVLPEKINRPTLDEDGTSLSSDEQLDYYGKNLKWDGLITPDVKKGGLLLEGKTNYFKIISLNKDGSFSKRSLRRTFTCDGHSLPELLNLVEQTFVDNDQKIVRGEFPIKPNKVQKNGKTDFDPCEYCRYKDLCLRYNLNRSIKTDDDEEDD